MLYNICNKVKMLQSCNSALAIDACRFTVLQTVAEGHTLGLLHLNSEKSSYRQFQRTIRAHCLTFITSFYTFR